MPERSKRNKYIRREVDVNATPVEEVVFVWTEVMRTPEFLYNRKETLRKEWPELWDALNRLAEGRADRVPGFPFNERCGESISQGMVCTFKRGHWGDHEPYITEVSSD